MKINRNIFIVFLSFYFVCLLNIPFWNAVFKIVNFNNTSDLIYLTSMFIGLSAMFTIIFNLLLFPYAQKTLIVVLAIAAIFSSYHMHYFKVVIDANMIQNVLQTDIHESLDLLSTKFGMWFLLQGAPLLSLYFFKTTYQPKFFSELKSRLIAIIIAALLIAVSVGTAYKTIVIIHRNNRNLISLITPINCIYYLGKYVKKKNQMPNNLF